MTAEEAFCDLFDKYGDDFSWSIVPFTKGTLVDEMKREIVYEINKNLRSFVYEEL